jgi:protein-tyrosine phosphatase
LSSWFRNYGFAEVADGLVVGAYPVDAADVAMLVGLGIDRVLNLVDDREYRPGERETVETEYLAAGIVEHRYSLVDFGNLPGGAVEAAVREVYRWLYEGHRVYLHCRAGWQRSAAVAAGVVAIRDGIDIDEALRRVQLRKPSADPLPHQRADLRRWWDTRSTPW